MQPPVGRHGQRRVVAMDRRLALAVAAGVGLVILIASVATAGEVRLWHDAPAITQDETRITPGTVPTETSSSLPPGDAKTTPFPDWIGAVVSALILVAVLFFAVVGSLTAWRYRPRLRWRRRAPSDDFDVLPDVVRALSADAADQRAALRRGAPRNAIVECWLRLEAVVARAGLNPDPADTSTEFTSRVLAAYSVDRAALLDLSALYREARFSTHEMGEPDRDAAIAALDALHDGLRARGEVNA